MMMAVIDFEEKIEVFKDQIKQYLLNLGTFLDFLCGNFLFLGNIHKMGKTLMEENKELEHLLTDLFNINPENMKLLYLSIIFLNIGDFYGRKLHHLINSSKRITN